VIRRVQCRLVLQLLLIEVRSLRSLCPFSTAEKTNMDRKTRTRRWVNDDDDEVDQQPRMQIEPLGKPKPLFPPQPKLKFQPFKALFVAQSNYGKSRLINEYVLKHLTDGNIRAENIVLMSPTWDIDQSQ
jgi:hypothetical protein